MTGFSQLSQMFGTLLLISAVFYVYLGACIMTIARKTGTPGAWMAWVPIANTVLLCRVAKRPGYWVLLMLIPLVNLIVLFVVLIGVAKARGKSPALPFLLLIPGVGLVLVPLLLASGSAVAGSDGPLPAQRASSVPPGPSVKAAAAVPSVCPACGSPECVGEEFCGFTGQRITGMVAAQPSPAVPAAPAVPATAGARGPGMLAKVLAALVLLAGAAATGLGLFSSFSRTFSSGGSPGASAPGQAPGGRAAGQAQAPPASAPGQAPVARASGTMTLFPVDNAAVPARPVSVVSQSLRKTPGQTLKVPPKWLPPGITTPRITNMATNITSVEYKTHPGDAPVDVHVLDVPKPPESAVPVNPAGELTQWVGQAAHADPTGVKVTSPNGAVFTGDAVKTPQMTVYVLNNPDRTAVVIIYASDPAARATADRLAGDVGNGQGLADYPETRQTLNLTPGTLSGGLQLESSSNIDPSTLATPQDLQSVVGQSEEARQWISKTKSYLPNRLTAATYRDPSRRPWEVLIGDFGGSGRSMYTWYALRFLVGLAGMQSTGDGLTVDQGAGRFLVERNGKYILMMRAPSGESADRVAAAARGFQF